MPGYLAQVLASALADDGDVVISDGFDGSANITLPLLEIKKLAKESMTRLPSTVGEFKLSVKFVPNDPSLPF